MDAARTTVPPDRYATEDGTSPVEPNSQDALIEVEGKLEYSLSREGAAHGRGGAQDEAALAVQRAAPAQSAPACTVSVSAPERSTRPGTAPVNAPRRTISVPLTRTWFTPTASA